MIKRFFIGIGIAFASAALMLAVLAMIGAGMDDPRANAALFGLIAFFAGSLAAGIAGALLSDDMPALGSAVCGAVYVGLIFVASLFFRGKDTRPLLQSMIVYGLGILLPVGIGLFFRSHRSGSRRTRKNLMKKMGKRA